jgi:hypothetical protein
MIKSIFKTLLAISVLLNVVLLGCLVAFVSSEQPTAVESGSKEAAQLGVVTEDSTASAELLQAKRTAFRWSQLVSTNDYDAYVANLKAIGCPEQTIRDIVKGDVERAFSVKRQELGLNDSGTGPWSKQAQARLVDGLVSPPEPGAEIVRATTETGTGDQLLPAILPGGAQPVLVSSGSPQGTAHKSDPLGAATDPRVLQSNNVDGARHADPGSTDSLATHRQTAADSTSTTQNSDSTVSQDRNSRSQIAMGSGSTASDYPSQESADDALRAALGTQAYLAQQYEHYYTNFEAMVLDSGSEPLTINPDQLSK